MIIEFFTLLKFLIKKHIFCINTAGTVTNKDFVGWDNHGILGMLVVSWPSLLRNWAEVAAVVVCGSWDQEDRLSILSKVGRFSRPPAGTGRPSCCCCCRWG